MARPLNILTLSTLFPNRVNSHFGIFVERQTAELASRSEANVTVINPIGMPPWPLSNLSQYAPLKSVEAVEDWHGLKVYRPQFRLFPKIGSAKNPQYVSDAVIPLAKQLHRTNPFDVIDTEFFYPDGPAALRLAKALGIPFTIKARGADIHHWGNDPGCRSQIREAAEQAAGLLAVSQALKDDMIALGMDGKKTKVHYTGVDQELFKPVDRKLLKSERGVAGPLLITTGALIPRKNQDLVIKALKMVPSATLLVAGSGPEERSYRKLADSLDVADRVRFLGNISHENLAQLTAAADISVLVSKSEGLANAWVEALTCGTPLVISEAGGARELIHSKVAGRIVDQDATSIANAVNEILSAPPAQADVRATVRNFSWKTNGDQLLEFFQSIVRAP